jgi:hypothetical protein
VDDPDTVLHTWGELAAVPILGAIALTLIFCAYKVAVLMLDSKKEDD